MRQTLIITIEEKSDGSYTIQYNFLGKVRTFGKVLYALSKQDTFIRDVIGEVVLNALHGIETTTQEKEPEIKIIRAD